MAGLVLTGKILLLLNKCSSKQSDRRVSLLLYLIPFSPTRTNLPHIDTLWSFPSASPPPSLSPVPASSPGQQQRSGVPALPGPSEGVPGPAGGPGAAGPHALPPRERALQPHHHVRAGVVAEHAEEAGLVGVGGDPRGGQFQHAVPQAGVN